MIPCNLLSPVFSNSSLFLLSSPFIKTYLDPYSQIDFMSVVLPVLPDPITTRILSLCHFLEIVSLSILRIFSINWQGLTW
jgi:hypothetical protein